MQPADFILHCKLGDLKSYYRPPNTTIILAGVAALPSLLTIFIYIYICFWGYYYFFDLLTTSNSSSDVITRFVFFNPKVFLFL